MDTSRLPIEHLHAVILAGGSGTRFWPLSRELSPKQFLSIFGGTSLLTSAVRRITPFLAEEGLHVVTGERLFDELRNHLASQPTLAGQVVDYLVEPISRNTAPAIALAAAVLLRRDPDALIAVLPADHLLDDGRAWEDALRTAAALATDGRLVTIGLKPDRPETGYGCIRSGEALPGHEHGDARGMRVAEFVEKPDRDAARGFIREGGHLWNSGILVARADKVLEELRAAGRAKRTPDSSAGVEIAEAAEWLASVPAERWRTDEARGRFAALPAVPFDKAVLEVSDRVAVVPVDLDWSDVGSLRSIGTLAEPDERGNVLVGRAVDVDSRDVIVYSADRLVATLGLTGTVVIDTTDATLVASKDRLQDVRLVVEALRDAGAPELVASRTSLRPWGSWTLLMTAQGFQIKTIDVHPGHRLSLQSHSRRSEHWIVVEGTARVEVDELVIDVLPNASAYVPAGSKHRLANSGDVPLTVIEVAVGDYLGEDDIVRYADDWSREK